VPYAVCPFVTNQSMASLGAVKRIMKYPFENTVFFPKSHMYIPDILNFTITYAEEQSLWKCAKTAGVGYGSTAIDWGGYCRELFRECSRLLLKE